MGKKGHLTFEKGYLIFGKGCARTPRTPAGTPLAMFLINAKREKMTICDY